MSTTIIAVIINLLATVLPWMGISIAPADLTTTAQVIVAIITGAYIWYQRSTNLTQTPGNSDVTAAGIRKA